MNLLLITIYLAYCLEEVIFIVIIICMNKRQFWRFFILFLKTIVILWEISDIIIDKEENENEFIKKSIC